MKKKGFLFVLISLILSGCNSNSNNNKPEGNNNMDNRKVVIIGVDGAGHNFDKDHTPNTYGIFNNYAKTYNELTSNPTISAQCWGSLLTGVSPELHNFTNDSTTSNHNSISDDFPTFFKTTRNAFPNAKLASFVNWNAINYGMIEDDIGVYKVNNSNDNTLSDQICDYISENNDFKLLYVQFDSVDHAGHTYQYDTQNYFEALSNVDDLILDIYQTIYNQAIADDTLFIVTADHGGKGYSHGGLTDEEKYVFFGARNKCINNATLENMQIRDIPAIVSFFLGITPSVSFDSYIPKNMFKDLLNPTQRESNIVYQTARQTPNLNNNLLKHFSNNDFKTLLTFDNQLDDVITSNNIESIGKVYYQEGIYGNALKLSNEGYVKLNNVTLNDTDSFSISTFINIQEDIVSDPCFIANKDWDLGKNSGLTLAFRQDQIKLSIGKNGTEKVEGFFSLPENFKGNWVHVLFTFDNVKKEVRCYYNFKLCGKISIPSNVTLVGNYPLTLGQDGKGTYPSTINFLVDDFMIFNKKLDLDDISYLKEYYK